MIGGALRTRLDTTGGNVIATSRRKNGEEPKTLYLDLSQPVSAFPLPPDLTHAFFCAGATGLKNCQENPAETRTVNVTHSLELAKRLTDAGVFTVYLSTSRTNAGDVYTEQKLEAERGMLSLGANAAVVKLSKVFAPDAPLVQGWKKTLLKGDVIEPFSDMDIAPLSAQFVADALARTATGRHAGVINLGPVKSVTYADLARHLAECLGVVPELVKPVTAASRGISVDSPMAGETSRMETELDLPAPDPYDEFDKTFGLTRDEKS